MIYSLINSTNQEEMPVSNTQNVTLVIFNEEISAAFFKGNETESIKVTHLLELKAGFHKTCGQIVLEAPINKGLQKLLGEKLDIFVSTFEDVIAGRDEVEELAYELAVAGYLLGAVHNKFDFGKN